MTSAIEMCIPGKDSLMSAHRKFIETVRSASGQFSYVFYGSHGVCDPAIYIARNYPHGLPQETSR